MRILFLDGTDGYTPDRKDTKACGGILTSLTVIPRYLASKGHEVFVKSTHAVEETIEGVHYVVGSQVPKWDVMVLNRNLINHKLVDYSHSIGAKVVWWLHDIPQFQYCEDSSFRKVDQVVALSQYCQDAYQQFYSLPSEKFTIIPNGVDTSVFYPGPYEERKPLFLMASALIKGYHPIETLFTNLKRVIPEATLRIYSSQALHGLSNSPEQTHFLEAMKAMGAEVRPPVPQPILASVMRKASLMLMPNTYPEICSNLLLQAQACGLPVVTSPIGSAQEFINSGHTGVLTRSYPHDLFLWWQEYAEAALSTVLDKEKHRHISELSSGAPLPWTTIGERWNNLVESITR